MKRRTFLKTTLAAAGMTGTAATLPHTNAADNTASREYYEIRAYTLKTPEKQALLDAYLSNAAIPALNKLGVKSVGVFAEEKPSAKPVVYMILPYASLDLFARAAQVLADESLQKAGAEYLGVPAADPVYERVESWLTLAFSGMPRMSVPTKGNQLYQLRIYESHSEKAGKKKVEMFNVGEIAIFQRVGLTPVFFGETILGPRLPNLTYMLTFPNAAAKDQAWKQFVGDSDWARLKGTPGYADKEIVSKITNILLMPTPYSQL